MPFDLSLAERVRAIVKRWPAVDEKKMFGGLCFLQHGNLVVGIWRDSLIVRVGPTLYEDALSEDFVTEFDVTGKPMKGWVMVLPEGVETDAQLHLWVERAARFVRTLPMKWENSTLLPPPIVH